MNFNNFYFFQRFKGNFDLFSHFTFHVTVNVTIRDVSFHED